MYQWRIWQQVRAKVPFLIKWWAGIGRFSKVWKISYSTNNFAWINQSCFRKVSTSYYKIRQRLVLKPNLNHLPLTWLRNRKYAYILLLTDDTSDLLMNAKLIWRLKRDYEKALIQQRLGANLTHHSNMQMRDYFNKFSHNAKVL